MEGIRFAWKIFSFSDVPTRPRRKRSSARRHRRRHRRITLHRACSVPLTNSSLPPTISARTNRPGAYAMTRTRGPPRRHRVAIPSGITPGSEFTAVVGSQEVQVLCPLATATSGNYTFVRVVVPGEPVTRQAFLKRATLTMSNTIGNYNSEDFSASKSIIYAAGAKQKAFDSKKKELSSSITFKVPASVRPSMAFVAVVHGKRYSVTCPQKLPRNRKLRILLPVQQVVDADAHKKEYAGKEEEEEEEDCTSMVNVTLKYDETISHGWTRTVRPSDLKFQWVQNSTADNVRKQETFITEADGKESGRDEDSSESHMLAYNKDQGAGFCRQLTIQEGKDKRLPTGTIALIPAKEAFVESYLSVGKNDKDFNNDAENTINDSTTFSYKDIADIQPKSLEHKSRWFRSVSSDLAGLWEDGNIKIVVRREHLLEDSIQAVMSLGKDQMRQPWRFEFVHEPGVDSGGLTREWFQLASEQTFDPDNGLWLSSSLNQMCVGINPDSAAACSDDHLVHFRFAGRLLGRALFDQQIVTGHFVPFLYKHLLGWPLTVQDLVEQDRGFFDSLQKLHEIDDLSALCLDFTVTEHIAGKPVTVELLPGGADKMVTKDNLEMFLEALLRYRMLQRTRPQLTELLLGFLDVVPEAALSVFDPKEIELILCGLPMIDVDDWKANTRYSGTLTQSAGDDELVQWFWDIVNDFDQKKRALLLQFATGTSGVPSRGFAALQGSDGTLKTFAIRGTESGSDAYPRAHTCFNRVDLPRYESKEAMCAKLTAAVTHAAVGFGMD